MQLIQLATWIALGTLCGCSNRTLLQDEFKLADLQLSYDDKLRMEAAAPIVVLGKVTEVKVIGRPHRSQAEPRVWVQLKQIAVQIEETIKGRASDDTL